ncbi:MAG TPA: DUF3231 family protein [Symbiobacteriaceae bacterium]|nr:DUF3231 family protein [Symbiobacteriaceae bacterium]
MNWFEHILNTVTKPKGPLHYGEVMNLWTFLAAIQESRAFCLTALNHTEDPELKRIMERAVKDIEEPAAQQITELLKNEGVPLPQTTQDKTKANPADVPPGAKMLDEEIALYVLGKLEGLLLICSSGLMQSLRNDVSAMFYNLQARLLGEGYLLKNTMQERGWLKIPPFHYPSTKA